MIEQMSSVLQCAAIKTLGKNGESRFKDDILNYANASGYM